MHATHDWKRRTLPSTQQLTRKLRIIAKFIFIITENPLNPIVKIETQRYLQKNINYHK